MRKGVNPSGPLTATTKSTWCLSAKKDTRIPHMEARFHHNKMKYNISKNQIVLGDESIRSYRGSIDPPRPNLGRKVDRPQWFRKPLSKGHKARLLKFLRDKRYKSDRSLILDIQSRLTGVCFYSKWVYMDIVPYIRLQKGWTAICRRLPFHLIPLVLQQLVHVPSSLERSFFRAI